MAAFAYICQKCAKKSIFATFLCVFCTFERYVISARPNYAKYALQICFWCISAHSKRAETLQSHRIGQWWSGPKCHLVKNAKNDIFGRKTHQFKQNTRTSAHLILAQKDLKCIRMCSPINLEKSIPGSGISPATTLREKSPAKTTDPPKTGVLGGGSSRLDFFQFWSY